jgi:hypothetical protein
MQSIGRRPLLAQNQDMSDENSGKVLVRRPSRVDADDHGRSVSADSVDSAELELVSTQMLKQILSSSDAENRAAVKEAAMTTSEGVLARDPATGYFEIIEDDELQAILDSGQDLPKLSRPSDVTVEPLHDYADCDHLSLVSTQALRRVLDGDDEREAAEPVDVDVGCFNPYDSG